MLEERREQTFADWFGAIGPVARGRWAQEMLAAGPVGDLLPSDKAHLLELIRKGAEAEQPATTDFLSRPR